MWRFVESCTLELEKGCNKYEELCYPQTGYNPYEKYFGKGVMSGTNTLYLDNSKASTDALVVLQNKITGIKVRSKFVRSGEDLTMRNIPNGNYWIKQFDGNNWTYEAIMPDGITKGGFTINRTTERINMNCSYGCNFEITLYEVVGGTAKSEQIDFNEFMK